MAGIDATIPLGVKTPDPMTSLSSLLNVAKGAQDLQTGAQTLQQSQQKTQQGGIDLQERQGLQQVLSDPGNYTAPDGSFDPQKAQANIMKVAPTTGMKAWTELADAHAHSIQAQRFLNSQTDENRGRIGQAIYSAINSPPDVVEKTLDTIGQQYKGGEQVAGNVKNQYRQVLQTQGPEAAKALLKRTADAVLPQETQQTINTPAGATLDNGQQSTLVNLKPGVPGMPQGTPVPGTQVQKLLPVGQQESTITDAQGNLHVQQRDAFGNIIGTRPLQASQPGAPGPFTLPPGETGETLKAAQNIRTNANNAARSVPDQQFNANQIIKLADETDLGKGSQYIANMKGAVPGLHWTSDKATNYNQVGHYLALQTAQLAQASGLGGTDAAHAISAEQAGDRQWTPDALKTTSRVNRALSTGADLFNRGVENAIKAAGSPIGARDFQNKWSQVANVDALRVYDAYKNRNDDPEGWKAAVTDLGGPASQKFKKTMQDVDAMRALVRGK